MQTQQNKAKWAKNAAIVVLIGATAFLGWDTYRQHTQNEQLEEHVIQMETKLDYNALETQKATEAFAQIEDNLAEIRKSEGYLVNNINDELDEEYNSEKRIMAEIATIQQLIADNKGIIADLETEVGEKDSRLKGYKNSVISLEARIDDYKARTDELVAQSKILKKDLATVKNENQDMTKELAMSEYMMDAQSKQLAVKNKQLRTVYYVTGPYKYLKDIGVAEKEGGILGIAAVKTVKTDLDRSKFTEVDMYHYTIIPIYGKDAVLLSNHDRGSYQFVNTEKGDVRWMNITDPELFWENTKYLVIETKGADYEETAQTK